MKLIFFSSRKWKSRLSALCSWKALANVFFPFSLRWKLWSAEKNRWENEATKKWKMRWFQQHLEIRTQKKKNTIAIISFGLMNALSNQNGARKIYSLENIVPTFKCMERNGINENAIINNFWWFSSVAHEFHVPKITAPKKW